MSDLRKSFYLCIGLWRETIFKLKYLAGFLIAFSAVIKVTFPYLKYTGENSIQIFEPVIMMLSERGYITYILLGYFFIISDAPFVNARVEQVLVRTDRRCWKNSVIFYLISQTLTYYGVILLMSIILTLSKGYIGNVWSQSFYILSKYGSQTALEQYGLSVPDLELLKMGAPVGVMIHSLLLICLYSFLLALIIFVFSLGTNKVIGSGCAIAVHFVGYLIISDSMFIPVKYSLLANGIFIYHNFNLMGIGTPDLFFSYCLFLFIILIIFGILEQIIRHCDIRKTVS